MWHVVNVTGRLVSSQTPARGPSVQRAICPKGPLPPSHRQGLDLRLDAEHCRVQQTGVGGPRRPALLEPSAAR